MNATPPKNPEEQGRMAATKWETPPCPYDAGTADASAWADGLLEGRKAFSWNTRNLVQIGSTCQYLSEAISTALAVGVAKSIFILGGESPVFFRLGFILNSHDHQVPILDVPGWRRIAQVVNRAMQGRALEEIGLTSEPTWFERIAFMEARSYMLDIIGHPAPSDPTPEQRTFTADTNKLIPWMGAKSPHHADLVPKQTGE